MVQVEILMYVALGFATAALIALLLGRLMWNLAISVGRRRAQRTSPTPAVAELQAERDRLRAEHAMLARRVEVRLDDLKRQVAEHMAEVSRSRNRMDRLGSEIEARDAKIEAREARLAERDEEIARLKQQVAALVSELAASKESLEALQAEHDRRADEIAALSQQLAERDRHIEALHGEVERLGAARSEAVSRERSVQERLKARIEDLSALSSQIEEQRRQLEHQQSHSQALRETLAEQRQPEGDVSAAPSPLETAETEEEQSGPPLERRVEDAERQASELQEELDRLDQMWAAKLADVARAVASEPPAAETSDEPAPGQSAPRPAREVSADKIGSVAVVNGSAASSDAAQPAHAQGEPAEAEDERKSGGLANVISLAQRIRALQRNGQ